MEIGKKIKLIRTLHGLTQKELAKKVGTHEVMIRKYELGRAIPKEEQLRKIANALNVNINSLRDFDINTDSDIMPMLFAIDAVFPITIKEVDGKPGLFFDFMSLNRCLMDWQAMKELVESGQQDESNYEMWKTIRPGITLPF